MIMFCESILIFLVMFFCIGLIVLVAVACQLRLSHFREAAMDESGAAYTLSFVMVVPILMLIVCAMVEVPLILSAKVGTNYAAFATARSAAVWSSAADWKDVEKQARTSGLMAFVPFSSGTQSLLSGGRPTKEFAKYTGAHMLYTQKIQSPIYLTRKFSYAAKHLKIEFAEQPEAWDSDITVNVTYQFPFNVPGVGRLLGTRQRDGRYTYEIKSSVTLHNEAPQSEDQSTGIGYGNFKL